MILIVDAEISLYVGRRVSITAAVFAYSTDRYIAAA